MGYGDGLGKALIVGAIICFLVGVFFLGAVHEGIKRLYHTDDIESSKPIIPIKKLVIENNKVDTVYIYKKP